MTAEQLAAMQAGRERAAAAKRDEDRADWVKYRTFLRDDAQRTRSISDATADGASRETLARMRTDQARGWRSMRVPRGAEYAS